MGLNSLLNFFKLDGIDDEYEDYEYDEYDEEEVPSVKKTSVPRKTSAAREIPEDSVKSKNGFLNNSKLLSCLHGRIMSG